MRLIGLIMEKGPAQYLIFFACHVYWHVGVAMSRMEDTMRGKRVVALVWLTEKYHCLKLPYLTYLRIGEGDTLLVNTS